LDHGEATSGGFDLRLANGRGARRIEALRSECDEASFVGGEGLGHAAISSTVECLIAASIV